MTPEEEARAEVHAILRTWKNTLTYDGRQIDFAHGVLAINLDDPEQLDSLAERAKSDPSALRLCLNVMHTFNEYDADWPASFKRLAVSIMSGEVKPKKGRGGDRRTKQRRDDVIVKAMQAAMLHQLPAYANGNEAGVTAAAIVADCLAEGDPEQDAATREPYGLLSKKAGRAVLPDTAAIIKIWQEYGGNE